MAVIQLTQGMTEAEERSTQNSNNQYLELKRAILPDNMPTSPIICALNPDGTLSAAIEYGKNANGDTYMKLADGTLFCTVHLNYTSLITSKNIALYFGTRTALPNYPVPFVGDMPVITQGWTSTNASAWPDCIKGSTLTNPGTINFFSDGIASPVDIIFYVKAIGRWKL